MKKHSLALIILLLSFAVSACSTLEGAGKDLQDLGGGMRDAVN